MKKILLLIITALIAVSTGLSLEPMKVAFYTTSTGLQTVRAEIKDNSTGTTLFIGEDYNLTPNDNGIIVINLKDNPTAGPTSSWDNVAATSINTNVTVDIYVGGALFSQQRLDALIMAQAQNGTLDQDGNLTPALSGRGIIGIDKLRWKGAYFEGNTVHIGPAEGEANDTEMRLSYDDNTNTGSIVIDDESVIEATKDLITVNKSISQNIDNFNTAFGTGALQANTGAQNTAFGYRSLLSNTSGGNNTAIGWNTLENNTATSRNVAVGNLALKDINGDENTAIGHDAGVSLTSGGRNTFVGTRAGKNDGGLALQAANVTNSVAIGAYAYTTADNQVVIGNSSITETQLAGNVNPRADNTLDLGSATNQWKDVYIAGAINGNNTTDVLTINSLVSQDIGDNNTAFGRNAFNSTANAGLNTLIGYSAGPQITDGPANTFIGAQAGFNTTDGGANTFIGLSSGYNNDGFNNTFVGNDSGSDITTGNNNTFVGKDAGNNGSQKIDATNSTAIGNGAYTTANNQVVIGNSSITETQLRGATLVDLAGGGTQNIQVDGTGKIITGGGGGGSTLSYIEHDYSGGTTAKSDLANDARVINLVNAGGPVSETLGSLTNGSVVTIRNDSGQDFTFTDATSGTLNNGNIKTWYRIGGVWTISN